jgi:hypothetical protein
VLTITTRSEADAACIARELAAFGSEVEHAPQGSRVNIAADFEVVPILSALETCLGMNDIGSVTVSYRGRTYVMEAASR